MSTHIFLIDPSEEDTNQQTISFSNLLFRVPVQKLYVEDCEGTSDLKKKLSLQIWTRILHMDTKKYCKKNDIHTRQTYHRDYGCSYMDEIFFENITSNHSKPYNGTVVILTFENLHITMIMNSLTCAQSCYVINHLTNSWSLQHRHWDIYVKKAQIPVYTLRMIVCVQLLFQIKYMCFSIDVNYVTVIRTWFWQEE